MLSYPYDFEEIEEVETPSRAWRYGLAAAGGALVGGLVVYALTRPKAAPTTTTTASGAAMGPAPRITGGAAVTSQGIRSIPGTSVRMREMARDQVDRLFEATPQPINPFALADGLSGELHDWSNTPNALAEAARIIGVQAPTGPLSPTNFGAIYRGFPAQQLATAQQARLAGLSAAGAGLANRSAAMLKAPEQKFLEQFGIGCAEWSRMSQTEKMAYYLRAQSMDRTQASSVPVSASKPRASRSVPLKPTVPSGQVPVDLSNSFLVTEGSEGSGHGGGAPWFGLLPGGILNAVDTYCRSGSAFFMTPAAVAEQLGLTRDRWLAMTGPERVATVSSFLDRRGETGVQPLFLRLASLDDLFGVSYCRFTAGTYGDTVLNYGKMVQYAPLLLDQVLVNDVCQSMFPDCYFCAAVGAWAWTKPADISAQLRSADATGVSIRLYSDDPFGRGPARDRGSRSIRVPLRSPTELFGLSRIRPPARYAPIGLGGRDARVSWSSAIELAKAGWEMRQDDLTGMGCPNIGQYLKAGIRNLRCAAAQLDGGTPTYWIQALGDDVWGNLSRICDSNGKIRHPMVAAVLPDGIAEAALFLNGMTVNDVVDFHVYSVLGKIERHGRRYVVLRNPWGRHGMTGPEVYTGEGWNTLYLGGDGVFALSFEAFCVLFDGGTMYGST